MDKNRRIVISTGGGLDVEVFMDRKGLHFFMTDAEGKRAELFADYLSIFIRLSQDIMEKAGAGRPAASERLN
jgi:hypothetical protein